MMLPRASQKARRKYSLENKYSLYWREASQLEPSGKMGKCCEGQKCCCYFFDFIPCFHSSSVRSQTQGCSMNTTCPCKDRPRVTAGVTVHGVSAALSVEEVRGQHLVSGSLVRGLYPHPGDTVWLCAALCSCFSAVSCCKTAQVSTGGH